MTRWSLTWSSALALAAAASAQGLWEPRANFPVSATEVSAAAIDGKIYAVCGITPSGSINRLFIYDPRTDAWSEGAPAPIPGGDHCNVAAAGGKLYLLGTIQIFSSFLDGNTYEYDPATNRWQTVGVMRVPRAASGVAAIGTRIYVAGGLAGGRSVADFEVFDTVTRAWTTLPGMPTARDHLTAQAVNGRFYAIGGRAGAEFTANEEFNPANNTWIVRAPLPTRRGGLASGVIAGRIVVFGGEGNSGTPQGTYRQNEEYDPATDTWRSLAPMLTPRHGLYGASLDDRVFAPSGGPVAGANYSNALEVFYLPPAAAPVIDSGGARNAASFDVVLAPGALASLFGDRFSFGEMVVTRFPLPLRMNAVEVRVNDAPVPLFFVGPRQINFLLPASLAAGPVRIAVSNAGSTGSAFMTDLVDAAPGIFSLAESGQGQGAILIGNSGLLAGAGGRAARSGDVVEIYCAGLGRVDNAPPEGQPPIGIVRTVETPEVFIAGVRAEVLFSGLAPGFAGVYQINARVPAGVTPGVAVAVAVRAGGRMSNTVTMAVGE
ncbi:MAG: Kelch repeat-containing protein [Bryobacteraceae bacterium]